MLLSSLGRDVRYAGRTLRRNPAFTLAAVLLLAVGIGGTTLVFSVGDAILLRELPVRAPAELARIVELTPNRPPVSEYPYGAFDEWRRRSRSFSAVFAQTEVDIAYADGQSARAVRAQIVTGGYYSTLGVEPLRGRLLNERDEWGAGGELPAVVSEHFWRQQFGGRETVLGQAIHLGGSPFTIVGVTAEGFNGTSVDTGPDIQVPLIAAKFITVLGSLRNDPRRCCLWEIGGRLRPGVTFAQAQSETSEAMQAAWEALASAARPLTEQDRQWIRRRKLRVEPLAHGVSWLRAKFSSGLIALLGCAVLLLVLACANVAGLLVARAAAEEQQNAIRLAVGASRLRLMQQWLTEGGLLALAGGCGALLVTRACLPLIPGLLPPMRNIMTEPLPPALHLAIDLRLFAFAALVCGGATLAAAISPAWSAAKAELLAPLKAGNSSRRGGRIRAVLVMLEVAIGTTVIANAGLLLATLRHLEAMNPGYERTRIVTFSVEASLQKYNAAQTFSLARRLSLEARNVPGVAAAAIAVKPLLRGAGMRFSVIPIGGKRSAVEELNSDSNLVGAGYFETLGIRLVAGRTFDARDLRAAKPIPAVVNETFVRQFFPGQSGVGQHFDGAGDDTIQPAYEIIGVVADTKYRSLREAPFPAMFTAIRGPDDIPQSSFELVVRTLGEPKAVVGGVRQTLAAIDPRLPFREVHTLGEDLDNSLWAEHTLARLGTFFSALALLLAAIGLYGLLSYFVVERSREIGLRMALGATPADIARVVGLRTLLFVAVGIGAGLGGAVGTAALARSLLFDVSPWNGPALAASAALVIAAAALATLRPALRAARLDPSVALRQ